MRPSSTLHSFFPGVFLGAVVGLIFGSLWATSISDAEMAKMRQAYESNYPAAAGADGETCALSTHSLTLVNDGQSVTVRAGSDVVETFTYEGFVYASFYDQNDEYAYISVRPDGLGGYILYSSLYSLYRIDLCSGETAVLAEAFMDKEADHALAVSPDEQLIALRTDLTTVTVRRIATGEELYAFQAASEYGAVGDAVFSPDSTKIAFAAAYNDAEAEGGTVYVGSLLTGEFGEYAKAGKPAGEGAVYIRGWLDNEIVNWY